MICTPSQLDALAELVNIGIGKGAEVLNVMLRSHIHREAVDKAIRSFVKAGGRELAGVRIFENTETGVR